MDKSSTAVPMVLGGGGMRGPCAVGALKRLSKEGISGLSYTGVSIGSLLSTMYSNGRTEFDLKSWFLDGMKDWKLIASCLVPSINPLRHIGGGIVDMLPIMRETVEQFNLKPQKNLRIITFDLIRRKPVVFEGEDYDLALAMSASCTIPVFSRPVPYWKDGEPYLLVDGGLYHPHPGEFSGGPALVVKLVQSPEWLHGSRAEDVGIQVGKPGSKVLTKIDEDTWDELTDYGKTRIDRFLKSQFASRKLVNMARG